MDKHEINRRHIGEYALHLPLRRPFDHRLLTSHPAITGHLFEINHLVVYFAATDEHEAWGVGRRVRDALGWPDDSDEWEITAAVLWSAKILDGVYVTESAQIVADHEAALTASAQSQVLTFTITRPVHDGTLDVRELAHLLQDLIANDEGWTDDTDIDWTERIT